LNIDQQLNFAILTNEDLSNMKYEQKNKVLSGLEKYSICLTDYIKSLSSESNIVKDSQNTKASSQTNKLKRKMSVNNDDLLAADTAGQSKLAHTKNGLSFQPVINS